MALTMHLLQLAMNRGPDPILKGRMKGQAADQETVAIHKIAVMSGKKTHSQTQSLHPLIHRYLTTHHQQRHPSQLRQGRRGIDYGNKQLRRSEANGSGANLKGKMRRKAGLLTVKEVVRNGGDYLETKRSTIFKTLWHITNNIKIEIIQYSLAFG
jgi:hypothetical protein